MSTEGTIRTVIGGLVSIKVIETGMKAINRQRIKVKKEGMLYDSKKTSKGKKKFY